MKKLFLNLQVLILTLTLVLIFYYTSVYYLAITIGG